MSAPHIQPSHKGLMHKDLGIPAGKPISAAALMRELHSRDPKKRARGNFARMAKRGWEPLKE